ncbi:hypothetical protein ACQP04_35650 [Pseudonocardia halophobica]|uniref:hypothetical protein n=1 Tax=Pseudonocardia halophobica TaxID=29401 RepID=UPI003D8F5481
MGAVGLIEEPEHVIRILADGDADVVFAVRATLRDPNWARKVLKASGSPARWPDQYAWAIGAEG